MATKKSTSTRKKSSSSSARSAAAKKRKKEQEFKEQVRMDLILIPFAAVSILLFISNFGIAGKVGAVLSSVMFGLYGVMAYVFPILLLVATLYLFLYIDDRIAIVKTVASVFIFHNISFIASLISGYTGLNAIKAYRDASEGHNGGGFVGGLLYQIFVNAFGKVGAYIIAIVVILICLVIIFEKSFVRFVGKGGVKTASSVKHGSEKLATSVRATREEMAEKYEEEKKEREERKEEKKEKRKEKKVSGVAVDLTVGESKKGMTDNLRELRPDHIPGEPSVTAETNIPLTAGVESSGPKISGMVSLEPSPAPAPLEFKPENAMPPVPASVDPIPVAKPEPVHKPTAEEKAQTAAQVSAEIEAQKPIKKYVFPRIELLKKATGNKGVNSQKDLQNMAERLESTLATFGVHAKVINISCGPSVTRYELQPEMGTKVSKILGLKDDIRLNLAATDVRIEAPVPGTSYVGIELPNSETVMVSFRNLMESNEFKNHKSKICFGAGLDIAGNVIVGDIAKMPHVLIAGATGSGKSVCINTIVMSILYKADPKDVKLLMIDPKVVELSVYNGIPHLLLPVVTDPKKAAGALNWAVAEMTRRFETFAECGVRDLAGYNEKIDKMTIPQEQKDAEKLPQIVIIVDEMADLMMVAGKEVEESICRIAQLARACGIHLILATQRPSVDVITGLIKANMPSRISFAVSSGTDSRTILDMNGAEDLLGKGDMLYFPQGLSKPLRVQGAFVSDDEVHEVVKYIIQNNGNTQYDERIQESVANAASSSNTTVSISSADDGADGRDSFFVEAARLIVDKDKASIGMLQRYLKIGFNRAARIMDQLEEAGVVGPEVGTKPREVRMSATDLENYLEENG